MLKIKPFPTCCWRVIITGTPTELTPQLSRAIVPLTEMNGALTGLPSQASTIPTIRFHLRLKLTLLLRGDNTRRWRHVSQKVSEIWTQMINDVKLIHVHIWISWNYRSIANHFILYRLRYNAEGVDFCLSRNETSAVPKRRCIFRNGAVSRVTIVAQASGYLIFRRSQS